MCSFPFFFCQCRASFRQGTTPFFSFFFFSVIAFSTKSSGGTRDASPRRNAHGNSLIHPTPCDKSMTMAGFRFLNSAGFVPRPPTPPTPERGAGAPPNLTKKRSIKTQTRHTHGNTHNLYNERQLGRERERKSMEGRTRARGSALPLISPGFVHTLAPGYVATIPTVPTVQLHRDGSEDDPRGDSVSA